MADRKKKLVKAPPVLSTSTDLVPVGPRHIQQKYQGRRDENGERPTTVRALVLRNGKYGARGTGEIVLTSKISGREKLDLLAEDLIEQSKKAVLSPFKLEPCIRTASSQFNAYLDDISALQDPESFARTIEVELSSRLFDKKAVANAQRNPSYIASLVSTRIHNSYMLASVWKIVLDCLNALDDFGLDDKKAQIQLQQNEELRSGFLALYDIVSTLVDACQARFAVLATTAPHYAQYFKKVPGSDPDDPDVVFDWDGIRTAYKSFLDSIIIELCFPKGTYPKHILYQILREAVDESPKEAKRFPQALWDAVGDLSITVDLQTMLERLLLGPVGEELRKSPRHMPEEYEQWESAQTYSEIASEKSAAFKDIIYPLSKTRSKSTIDSLWRIIDLNYKAVSGMDIDTLWLLKEARVRKPAWHSFFVPAAHDDSDSDSDSPPGLAPIKGKAKPKQLAITNGGADDSDDSMPSLQSVSDRTTSEEETEDDDDEEDSDADDWNDDDESDYDTDEEDETRELLREAMDIAAAVPDFHDHASAAPEFDELTEDRKGNPFIKLLGSLRGRMFSTNPKLRTTARTRKPAPPPGAAKTKPSNLDDIPELEPIRPRPKGPSGASAQPKSHKTTVEEVEDEDDTTHTTKKKKKKPKKKKKSTSSASTEQATAGTPPPAPAPAVPAPAPPPSATPSPSPASPPRKKTAPAKPMSPPARAPSVSSSTLPGMSTTSLPLPAEQTAQSARSYLQSEKVEAPKTKIKSRPDHPSLFGTDNKSSFFSKFSRKDKEQVVEPEKQGTKRSWFSKLGKKTSTYMHQLLNTSEDETKGTKPMKWDTFLKVMREMGFEYDPSTAGSSVRFDPPDKRDRSITFHKPHPDPTLYPVKLKEFGKKLKDYYGWTDEDVSAFK
ncbi:hypothetical protein PLICRDRAFT_37552 [Plicaturopsis crispa FD-325 SS-3]|nr:hypothetical protein PLICRDRAFT_37552 [Plicaturopsis crispa FD-325 SS-3]